MASLKRADEGCVPDRDTICCEIRPQIGYGRWAMRCFPLFLVLASAGTSGALRASPTQQGASTVSAQHTSGSSDNNEGGRARYVLGAHPGSLPWGASFVGVSWLDDAKRGWTPIVESGGVLRAMRWSVSLLNAQSPDLLHSHLRIENGFRLWGAPARRGFTAWGASHGSIGLGYDSTRHADPATATTSTDIRFSTRLDFRLLSPRLSSFFSEALLGYGGRRSTRRADSKLRDLKTPLYGAGVGLYVGDPTTQGCELTLSYLHHYNSYAEAAPRFSSLSEPRGHWRLEAHQALTATWGLGVFGETGEHAVWGVYLTARAWSESAHGNALFDLGQ